MRLKHIAPTFKSGYKCASAQRGFSVNRCSPLVGTKGSFTSDTDRVIIGNYFLTFMYDVYDGTESFVLLEDNCEPHRAAEITAIYRMKKMLE